MFRIFKESYSNYISQFSHEEERTEYRFRITEPLSLLTEPEVYKKEKISNSDNYKKVSDLLIYMDINSKKYPKFKSFLWTLESRGIEPKYFGEVCDEDLSEQAKLVNMFLNLMYW